MIGLLGGLIFCVLVGLGSEAAVSVIADLRRV